MTALRTILNDYASGQTDWPTAKDQLIAFPYKKQERYLAPATTPAESYLNVEKAGITKEPDTWDEVNSARNRGIITSAQLYEIQAGILKNRDKKG